MSRRSVPFTQIQITRLIKGALAAGVAMERIGVKATPEGPLLCFGDHAARENNSSNEWDEVLEK